MRRSLASVVCAAAILVAAPASAATFMFAAPLTPEVPGATGSGSVSVILDDTARTLAIMANWSGLSGVTTVAHIHCCVAPPGTVGVAVTPGTLPGFPTGVSSGSYSTVLDLSLAGTYTSSFLTAAGGTDEGAQAALLAGLQGGTAYFNIHTNTFQGGEIRGFLAAVPEPQSWALMILGFGAVGAAMRRSRRVRSQQLAFA
jgi:hypothetical protein